MKRFYRDPLVLFLLAGAVIFWLAGLSGEEDSVIEVSEADLNRLNDQWSAQMGRPPTPAEMNGLIDQFIHEEVYYREALSMGLDANDTIIRRRLVQKLTFLTEDVATGTPPSEAELVDYYETHKERYRTPERFSFRHRYFSSDRREDAEADARAALDDPSANGDPFMLQRQYAERSQREIANLFGTEFGNALAKLEASSDWQGPIQSAYGWHVVSLEKREASSLPGFEAASRKVAVDLQADQRAQANAEYFESRLDNYEVIRP